MKKLFALCMVYSFTLSLFFALDTPAENASQHIVFCQNSFNTFSRGIIFDNAETVRAAESGTTLIVLNDSISESSFPSALGTSIILIHDDNLITVYGNLDENSIPEQLENVDIGTMVGKTGTTGYSGNNTLEFQISDLKHKKRINPQLLLPSEPDSTRPVISDVSLQNESSVYQSNARRIKQGKYMLFASVTDRNGKENVCAPFQIAVTQNGHEIQNLLFETLQEENGRLKLACAQSLRSFEEIYGNAAMITAICDVQLKRGKNDVTITARDIAGNENSINWSFTVD